MPTNDPRATLWDSRSTGTAMNPQPFSMTFIVNCRHCGYTHIGQCPRIKAIEYHECGAIKRVEYKE